MNSQDQPGAAAPRAFTCPCCQAVSASPEDARQGYCARCHWQTADPELGPLHLAGPCTAREQAAQLNASGRLAFRPDCTIPPGDILGAELEERGLSVAEAAAAADLDTAELQAVIDSRQRIDGPIAERLHHALGPSAEFWLNLQQTHEAAVARGARVTRVFRPDWTVHPGIFLRRIMANRGITQEDLSRPPATMRPDVVQGIIDGTRPVDQDLAIRLAYGTGVLASFWLDVQAAYDAGTARGASGS